MQMQRMEMRMKLPLKHDTHYAEHFAEVYSEPCKASDVKLFAKTVNDLKSLKTVIALENSEQIQSKFGKIS